MATRQLVNLRAGVIALVAGALCMVAPGRAQKASADTCPCCAWQPPVTARTVQVSTIADLERAIAAAGPDTTVLLADGLYRLTRMLDIAAPRVVIRGKNRDLSKVVLRGAGITERQ